MKLGMLFLLAGTAALAGCSANSAGGVKPAATPASLASAPTPAATLPARPAATADPKAAPTATAAVVALGPTPKPADALSAGNAALRAHNYGAAERDFQIALQRGRPTLAAQKNLALAAMGAGDYATAYRAYTHAAIYASSDPTVLYGAAYTALNTRNYHAAIDYAAQYIKLRPNDANGYHVHFLAEGQLLNAKAQLADARAIARLQPNNAESYNELGIALGNVKQYASSIAAFSQAIKHRSGYAPYYINRAIIENLDKQPHLALADLELAKQHALNPTMRHDIEMAIARLKQRMH